MNEKLVLPENSGREIVDLGCVGGLGDMFVRFFTYDAYEYLCHTKTPVDVLMFCSSPFAEEVFEHHPNRRNMRLHTLDRYPEFTKKHFSFTGAQEEEKRAFRRDFLEQLFGKNYRIRKLNLISTEFKPVFYTGLRDSLLMRCMSREKYAVMQPFASSRPKDIPAPIFKALLRDLTEAGFHVYLPVRKNVRASNTKDDFNARHALLAMGVGFNKRAHIIELGVPAVIRLIEKCSFFVGSDSAFVKPAWFYRRPTIFLLPTFLTQREPNKQVIAARSGNYTGLDYETTHWSTFHEFDQARAKNFMEKMRSLSRGL